MGAAIEPCRLPRPRGTALVHTLRFLKDPFSLLADAVRECGDIFSMRFLGFGDWVRAAYRDRDPRYYDQPRMFMPQWEWISDREGRSMVDFVGHFESLPDDFATLCQHLRLRAQLPHLKASKRRDYVAYYEPETCTIVGQAFELDLEHFGYEF